MKTSVMLITAILMSLIVSAQEMDQMEELKATELEIYISLSDAEKSRLLENKEIENTPGMKTIFSKTDSLILSWEPHPNVHHYFIEIRKVSEKVYSDYRSYYPAEIIVKKRTAKNMITIPISKIIESGSDFWKGEQTVKRFWQVYAFDKANDPLCEGGCYSKFGNIIEFSFKSRTIENHPSLKEKAIQQHTN